MALFGISIEVDGILTATPRQRSTALRKAFRFIGERHHKKYKHLKFTASAYRRYGLKPRGKRYEREKADRKKRKNQLRPIGEVLPFVYTGRTRQSTMAGNRVTVTRVSEAGTCDANVILRAPQLNRLPWLREEFERVNQQELRAQARAGLQQYERELKRLKTRKRKRKS